MAVVLMLAFLGVGVGGALVWFGKRGRKLDEHPVCTGCGFDLVGKPEGSKACAECGADLSKDGTVVIGNREKRKGILAAGCILVGICVLVAAWSIFLSATNWNYLPHAPTWLVISEAKGENQATRDRAFVELKRRISGTAAPSVVEAALQAQADGAKRWDARWGNLVEDAKLAGLTGPGQWERYLGQIVRFDHVQLRARVGVDEGAFVWVPDSETRAGESAAGAIRFVIRSQLVLRSGGVEISQAGPRIEVRDIPGFYGTQRVRFTPNATAQLGVGFREVALVTSWEVTGVGVYAGSGHGQNERKAGLTILPAGQSSVEIRARPELAAAVEKSLSVNSFDAQRTGYFGVEIESKMPPMDLACEALVAVNGREVSLGDFAFRANRDWQNGYVGDSAKLQGLAPGPVEIVLRPSARVAADTVDVFEVYGSEVRLRAEFRRE